MALRTRSKAKDPQSIIAVFAAMAIYAFHWLPLAFGSTVYPRTVSTTLVLAAVLARHGFRSVGLFYWGTSKAVVVFASE